MPTDKLIKNQSQDGDILVKVNVGGTETTALTIDGATGASTFAGNLTVSGTLSAGSVRAGDKNYVASGASGTTGWVSSGTTGVTFALSTTASELPEAYWAASGLKVTNANSGTGFIRYRFTLDAGDLSKKLSLSCYLESSASPAYAAGDFVFQIFETANSDYSSLTAVTLQTSSIPALSTGGFFNTTFDSSTRQFLELRITRSAGTNTSFVVFSSIKIGPGEIVQGAAISEWQSYPLVLNTNVKGLAGTAAINSSNSFWRRVGSEMQWRGGFSISGAGAGATEVTVVLPSGHTIDTSRLASPQTQASTM